MKTLNYVLIVVILLLIGYIILLSNRYRNYNNFIGKPSNIDQIKVKLEPYPKDTILGSIKSGKQISMEKSIDYLIDIEGKYSGILNYYNSLKNNNKVDIDPIDRGPAHGIHDKYMKKTFVQANDKTSGVLFEFPKIYKALVEVYGASTVMDSAFWSTKGFMIYLANYGPTGIKPNQTTCILQLAELNGMTTTPDDWKVLENRLFDFGNARPPDVDITNKEDTPEVP